MVPRARWTSDRLLPLRAFYFFSFGGLGALFPFLPLLLSHRGLDPSQIAQVLVAFPAASLLVPPLWGTVADAWQVRLPLLRVACLGCAASVLLLLIPGGVITGVLSVAAISFFRAPLTSLADAATYEAMGPRTDSYSLVRVWGSAGFAVFALASGLMQGSLHPLALLIITSLIYLAAGLSTLPLRSPTLERVPGVLRGIFSVVRRLHVVLYLVGSIVYYMGHATYDAFFALHAKSLGLGDAFVGMAWAFGVVIEIGIMLVAPHFVPRMRASLLLALCSVAAVARWLLLAEVSDPLLLGLSQGLHGLTFGLWYLSMVRYIQSRAPAHLRTSLQAVSFASMGLGMVIGFLGGGPILHHHGGAVLYGLASIAAAAAFFLYIGSWVASRNSIHGGG